MNIQQWLLDEKIASHWKQADNIIIGLKLGELYNEGKFEEIKTRAKLYRDIRVSGEKSKVAFEKAIKGEAVPVPMFGGVLHSTEHTCKDCGASLPTPESEMEHRDNCPAMEQEPEPPNMVQISRDMAIDAGDRSMEGQWIEW